jgi:hypothetical protein
MDSLVSPLPDSVLRARLTRARGELHELEGRVRPPLGGDLGTVLDIIETVLAGRFGWRYPEPLTDRDRAFLASVGCPASD